MASLSDEASGWIKLPAAFSDALLIAVRTPDKAAQNEYDMKRYQALMSKTQNMNPERISQALEETLNTEDTPEIESLSDVATEYCEEIEIQ